MPAHHFGRIQPGASPKRIQRASNLSKTLAAKKEPAQIADERQSQLKLLIARGKEQGFLTYVEVNDHLPSEIVDPEQIEDIVNMINDMGIPVYEKPPESESLLLTEPVVADEEGLDAVRTALSSYPMTFEFMLRQYEQVKAGQGRLVDIIVGFIDPNAPDEIAAPVNPKLAQAAAAAAPAAESEDDEEGENNSEDEEVLETGPDPEEAARRFTSIAKLHQ